MKCSTTIFHINMTIQLNGERKPFCNEGSARWQHVIIRERHNGVTTSSMTEKSGNVQTSHGFAVDCLIKEFTSCRNSATDSPEACTRCAALTRIRERVICRRVGTASTTKHASRNSSRAAVGGIFKCAAVMHNDRLTRSKYCLHGTSQLQCVPLWSCKQMMYESLVIVVLKCWTASDFFITKNAKRMDNWCL